MTRDLNQAVTTLAVREPSRYRGIDLNRLAAYGISVLRNADIPTTFELLVVALHRMFPEKFALEGFDRFPDAARVNRALLQLRPKYRGWALGDTQNGWALTDQGKAEVESVERILTGSPNTRASADRRARPRTRPADADLQPLEASRLFELYTARKFDEIDRFDLWACLQLPPSVGSSELSNSWRRLRRSADSLGRTDMIDFLDWVREYFNGAFSGGRRESR